MLTMSALDFEGTDITCLGTNTVISKAQILFGENYPRLQLVKKNYDPDNVFSKWFAITPAA